MHDDAMVVDALASIAAAQERQAQVMGELLDVVRRSTGWIRSHRGTLINIHAVDWIEAADSVMVDSNLIWPVIAGVGTVRLELATFLTLNEARQFVDQIWDHVEAQKRLMDLTKA